MPSLASVLTAWKMPALESGHTLSLWIYVIFVTSLQLCASSIPSITTAATADALPRPVLSVSSRSRDHVTLVCRAPQGHQGVLFILYQDREKVEESEVPQGSGEAEFRLSAETEAAAAAAAAADPQQQHHGYCCMYRNIMGLPSALSAYLYLEQPPQPPPGAAPPASPAPPPSPVLSVEPPGGRVRRGQMLSFHCSLPAETQPMPHAQRQTQTQSQRRPRPLTFLLLKTALVSGETSLFLQPEANQMPNSTAPHQRAFSVGPVQGGEGGSYACMYQFSSKRRRPVNSTVSNVIQVTVIDLLPRPTLTLQQQPGGGGLWHLSCRGPAAYPGSLFSLYRADSMQTVATHQAPRSGNHTAFPIPVQDQETARYECRYSNLLGKHWSDSERSLPLEVTRGISPTAPAGSSSSGVDWALLAGSFSAVVLFMAVVVLVVFVVQRKVRGAAAEKKKRFGISTFDF